MTRTIACRLIVTTTILLLLSHRATRPTFGLEEVTIPKEGMSIGLRFGFKDKQPSAWDGRLDLSNGKITTMEVSPPRAGQAEKGTWRLRTLPQPKPARKSVHDPKWGGTSYYYVRVEQDAPSGGYGALAWASPMWITLSRPE